MRESSGGFHAVEPVPPSWLDRFYAWVFRRIFKNNHGSVVWSALCFPLSIAFEWRAWKQLRTRIFGGEFDVVLRILPIDPKMPSPFSFFLRKGPIPFVDRSAQRRLAMAERLQTIGQAPASRPATGQRSLRSLYRLQPFARSTYANATAIIAGGSTTCREFARYRQKVFYVPGENGVNSSCDPGTPASGSESTGKLELIYGGRLVPLKAVDIALRGAASLLREGRAHLRIVGDGPERQRLENLADRTGGARRCHVLRVVEPFGDPRHAQESGRAALPVASRVWRRSRLRGTCDGRRAGGR